MASIIKYVNLTRKQQTGLEYCRNRKTVKGYNVCQLNGIMYYMFGIKQIKK